MSTDEITMSVNVSGLSDEEIQKRIDSLMPADPGRPQLMNLIRTSAQRPAVAMRMAADDTVSWTRGGDTVKWTRG